MGKHRDWTEIRQDYQENGLSYSALAQKYDVSLDTLKKAAARQKWTRQKMLAKVGRTVESVMAPVQKETKMAPAKTAPRKMAPAKMAPENLAPAYSVMDAEDAEERFQRLVDGMMDRFEEAIAIVPPEAVQALKLLASGLKDLRSLKRLDKDALDIEEQRARIAKLRSETRVIDVESGGGVLILPSIDEAPVPPESDDE